MEFGKGFCLREYYPKDNEHVLRYTNYAKFRDLVCTKTLYLARGDQFPDQYEGKETAMSENIRRSVQEQSGYNRNTELYERNRRCVAISCWSIGENDTKEMWEEFTDGVSGIAIQSDVSRLKQILAEYEDNICIRKVKYVDDHAREFTQLGCPFYPFLIKRRQRFSFEKELRVIWGEGKYCKHGSRLYDAEEIKTEGMRFPINLNVLIEGVIIPASARPEFEDKVRLLLEELDSDIRVRKGNARAQHERSRSFGSNE
jgi:hypothetical protein